MSRFRIPRSSPRRGHPGAPRKRTLLLELLEMRCVLTGTFTSLRLPQLSHGLGTLLLLTDGTVLAHETEQPDLSTNFPNVQYIGSKGWWRLSPGPNGFYGNGTWTQVHDMTYARAFFNEQVLPSGKVLVLGSECPKDINVLIGKR